MLQLLKMATDEYDSWVVENAEEVGTEDYDDDSHSEPELGAYAIPQHGKQHGGTQFQQYDTKLSSEYYEDEYDDDEYDDDEYGEDEVHTSFTRISNDSSKQRMQYPHKMSKSKQDGQDGSLPAGAVEGVVNPEESIYIARTKVGGKWVPATLIPQDGVCFAIIQGNEYASQNYQVLCNVTPKWFQTENTDDFEVPHNSLCVDSDEVGTKLYYGVVTTRNGSFLGKVSNGACYVLRDEEVQKFNKYQILTLSSPELQILYNRQRVTYRSLPQQNNEFSDEECYNTTQKKLPGQRPQTSKTPVTVARGERRSSTFSGPRSQHHHSQPELRDYAKYFLHQGTQNVADDEADYDWVRASNGSVPPGALVGCKNHQGPVYVARFKHQGVMLPGKLIPSYGNCYTAFNGEEIKSKQYEVLCNINAKWIQMTEGDKHIPSDAVLASSTNDDQDLYIGRIVDKASIGVVPAGSGRCIIIRRKKEQVYRDFEILVASKKSARATFKHHQQPMTARYRRDPWGSYSDDMPMPPRTNSHAQTRRRNTAVKVAAPTKSNIFASFFGFNKTPGVQPTTSNNGSWKLASDGEVPVGAVVGGRNLQGDIYVARVTHEGEILPGKLIPCFRGCFVSNNGKEFKAKTYEVLCDCDAAWIKMKAGSKIPDTAIPAGVNKNDEPLYVGHVTADNVTNLGKVEKSSGKCFVLKNKVEHAINDYEILVLATGKEPATSIAGKLSTKLDVTKIKGRFPFFNLQTDMSSSEQLIPLKTSEADYTLVEKLMTGSIKTHSGNIGGVFKKYDIIKIEKVWNKVHHKKFEHFRKHLVEDKIDQNEKLLFHGSPHYDQIWKSGFDERHATAGMFGAGIYFAENSSKSNQYIWGFSKGNTCPTHKDNSCYKCERKMLVCHVLLGKISQQKAAINLSHAPQGYNSVQGVPGPSLKYSEYIVYRGEQAFPSFLVTYKIVK
ncbi:hypothetical protein B566_EDAN014012 [Ephemera danica]|nr:hypothetical protein B566_EDAN014012 [Ephemera danica]